MLLVLRHRGSGEDVPEDADHFQVGAFYYVLFLGTIIRLLYSVHVPYMLREILIVKKYTAMVLVHALRWEEKGVIVTAFLHDTTQIFSRSCNLQLSETSNIPTSTCRLDVSFCKCNVRKFQ